MITRRIGTRLIAASLIAAFAALPTPSHAAIRFGYLYVSDYGLSIMERYKYTYDSVQNMITAIAPYGIGGNTTNAYFLGDAVNNPVKEGVHGTSNDLILVGGYHGNGMTNITRYTLDGQFIGQIPVNFNTARYNNGNVGIGNVLVTSDGRYMYAPLEAAGYIVKVDLTNGAIVADYAFAKAHDVAIAANGDVIAANYSAGAAAKVIVLDANLNYRQDLITALPSGVPGGSFRPTGLSIAADGSLYVNANLSPGNLATQGNSVLHYNITGSPGAQTATYDAGKSYVANATTNNKLQFIFGNNIGPDGKVYIAGLGGGGGVFGAPSGYVDGVYALDPLTGQTTRVIDGYTETAGPVGSTGLSAPKYLQFDTNFVTVPDQGYTATPEPGSATVLAVALGLLGVHRKHRRGGAASTEATSPRQQEK